MKNTHQHWRALTVNVPVDGQEDPWIQGRKYSKISADVSTILGPQGGLKGEIAGDRQKRDGKVVYIYFHFFYDDLKEAVEAFAENWETIGFPNRTRLTHVERCPDCSFKHHVMIRWIDGKMDPYSTDLTDDVLLNPTNG